MNCSQVREQLHPFADGELSPEEMEAVQAAPADCPDCGVELKELEATSLFAREAFTGPVADVDLSGVFDGVMARIAGILGEEGISIEAIQQKEPAEGETHVPLIMLSHRVLEGSMNEAIRRIEALDSVNGAVVRIRVETLAG